MCNTSVSSKQLWKVPQAILYQIHNFNMCGPDCEVSDIWVHDTKWNPPYKLTEIWQISIVWIMGEISYTICNGIHFNGCHCFLDCKNECTCLWFDHCHTLNKKRQLGLQNIYKNLDNTTLS